MERQFIPYFRDDRVEITIVVETEFRPLAPRHDREVLVVRDPWYPEVPEANVRRQREFQPPLFDRLYFLSNTEELDHWRRRFGFNSHYVNLGCFVDDDTFAPASAGTPKPYDAVITARFARHVVRDRLYRKLQRAWHTRDIRDRVKTLASMPFALGKHGELKRHWLSARIERLALLDPVYGTDALDLKRAYTSRPNCAWSNDERLEPAGVAEIVTRAHCGLALSELEGMCRASSEYLLCGVPVVSTRSHGGRDVWYDEYNAIVVEADVDAVYDAACALKRQPRDPWRIRSDYLARARAFRDRFRRDVLDPILSRFGVERDAADIMRSHPFRWWL